MCENCGPIPEDIKEAYDEFETAIKTFFEKTGSAEGILVDWVIVSSRLVMYEHGNSTITGWDSGINQQLYRTKGLMHEVLDNLGTSEVTRSVVHKLTHE